MVKKFNIVGFEEYKKFIEDHKNNTGSLFLLFSGSKDETGNSWCPDCVKAEPVIEKALACASPDAVFVHVEVGSRPTWKDQKNPFRTDPNLELKVVPTLIRYGTPMRLEEDQCAKLATVQMLFEES